MKTGVAVSITLSLILIGTATWFRFSGEKVASPELVVVDNFDASEWYFEDAVDDFVNPPTTGSASGTEYEPLTPTEIASRQLIVDYVGLAASGGANPESINALAEGQVDNLLSLHKFEKVNTNEVSIIPDSSTNARSYAEQMSVLYENYAKSMSTIAGNISPAAAVSGSLSLFINPANQAYEEMAQSMKKIKVPVSVSHFHIELINNALSNAAAMKAMANVEGDPVGVLAGLMAVKTNSTSEAYILGEIGRTLEEQI